MIKTVFGLLTGLLPAGLGALLSLVITVFAVMLFVSVISAIWDFLKP